MRSPQKSKSQEAQSGCRTWIRSQRESGSFVPDIIPRAVVCVVLAGSSLIAASRYDGRVHAQADDRPRLSVRHAEDFAISGTGDQPAWQRLEWTSLRRRQTDGHPYDSRFKMLYSATGLYFLMEGTDRTLTA